MASQKCRHQNVINPSVTVLLNMNSILVSFSVVIDRKQSWERTNLTFFFFWPVCQRSSAVGWGGGIWCRLFTCKLFDNLTSHSILFGESGR